MNIFTHRKRASKEDNLHIKFDKVINYLNEDIISSNIGYEIYDDIEYFDYNECYLELIVKKCESSKIAKYHDNFAYLYMKKISKLTKLLKQRMNNDEYPIKLEDTREKLLEFLEESQLISPSKLLQHAKKFQLSDEIIELNKKLKNHNAVLYTLVIDKKDHKSAIKYCMQTAPSSKDRSDRFLELLRLYFKHSCDDIEDDEKQNDGTPDETVDDEDDLDISSQQEPIHAKNQTINLQLLQQELQGGNDEFAFMNSMDSIRESNGLSGMDFNFDEDEDGANGDNDLHVIKDDFEHLPEEHEMFQAPTRSRNEIVSRRRGAISVGNKAESDALAEEQKDEGIDKELFFEKGCEILYEFAFDMDYLRVLQLLPGDNGCYAFKKVYIEDHTLCRTLFLLL